MRLDFFISVRYNGFTENSTARKKRKQSRSERKNEAMENKIIDAEKVSEYRIGGTTYFVLTFFNSNQNESLDDIIQRLIINDSKKSSVNTDEITNSRS